MVEVVIDLHVDKTYIYVVIYSCELSRSFGWNYFKDLITESTSVKFYCYGMTGK